MRANRWAAVVMSGAFAVIGQAAAETTLIRGVQVLDPGSGKVLRDAAVLVADGRIAAVGARALDAVGTADREVDLDGAWLMPGLMDTHTHLGAAATAEHLGKDSDATLALNAYRHGREMLLGGFTTVRDLGAEGNYAVADLRRQIELGNLEGPTILSAGKNVAPFGGDRDRGAPLPFHAGPTWHRYYIDADTPDEAIKAVRENIRYGARVIKLYADIHPYYLSAADVTAAVGEAHRAGVTVAAHVAGGPAADNVIAGGVDSIEHGFMLSETQLVAMRERGIFLSGTDFDRRSLGVILRDDARADYFAELIRKRLANAYRVGVKLAFGSDVVWRDGNRTRPEIVLDQLATWKAAGVPPLATLQAMTSNAAALLGIADERGAIAVGLRADLIAMPASPLEDPEALRGVCFVMKDGTIVRECRGVAASGR